MTDPSPHLPDSPPHAEPVAVAPALLHDGGEWFVLDKPRGWHCVESARSQGGPCVATWLAQREPALAALPELGLVHRLDRSTSGCLLVARSAEVQTDLREAMSVATGPWAARKDYLALVARGLESKGAFDLYFSGRHKSSAKVTARPHGASGDRGRCAWQVVRPAAKSARKGAPSGFDLVEIELIGPGRRHQIRSGFAFLGHPLAGDALYEGKVVDCAGDGAALHAYRLKVAGQTIEAPRPEWAISRSQR